MHLLRKMRQTSQQESVASFPSEISSAADH
jgi:hypothetical protein